MCGVCDRNRLKSSESTQSVSDPRRFYFAFYSTAELGPMLSIGSSSSDVCEPRTSTGSGLFALQSRGIEHIFAHIVSIRVKTLSNTNLVV